jgi:hypothetical protein
VYEAWDAPCLSSSQVPCEEVVVEIRERYLELNSHAKSYTFKALIRTSPETPDYTFEVGRGPACSTQVACKVDQ